jgi:hypothetical protein
MNNLEFLDYTPTPSEKHLGIATIKWGNLILRYKIVPLTKGEGFFAVTASFKVKDPYTNEDKYVHAIDIDSRSEETRVLDFVKSHVKVKLHQTGIATGQSSMPPVAPSLPAAWGIAPSLPVQESLPF